VLTRSFQLFRLFGFPIRIDLSWFIIVVLVTWSLAVGLFPRLFPGLEGGQYWAMGVAGALGLFVSILLHELAHALVARRFGLRMRGITLFIFGGVAEMVDEPPSAKAEFWVAVAGPVASVLIAAGCFGLETLGEGWPLPVVGVIRYMWWVNLILVAFNLLPAFPLDGGRVLRSALWHFKGSLRWATRITSRMGAGFGLAFIVLGVVRILLGDFLGGIWWVLIGMFLRDAARMSYQQLLMRRALEGEPVYRFMQSQVHAVPPELTVQSFVDDHLYRLHHKLFPVLANGRLIGCVGVEQVRQIPRESWSQQTVGQIACACGEQNTIRPDADAMEALAQMNRHDLSKLLVVEDQRLRGILSLKDLLAFISLKVELEDEPWPARSDEMRRHAPV